MTNYCCGNCFNDSFLEKQITGELGTCHYCNRHGISLIDPPELRDYFQQVIDLYTESTTSTHTIVELLKTDWELFGDLDNSKCLKLLEAIFPDEDFNKFFEPIHRIDPSLILEWESFREELKHVNRYFPKTAPDKQHMQSLFPYLVMDCPGILFRARINSNESGFVTAEMGKPPKEKATAGRANPLGIPYLYVASDPITAISECRPHKGDFVTVVAFIRNEPIRLIDLRNPKKTISPFSVEDVTLPQLYSDIRFLCRLGEELSRPVLPRETHLEYLPSQYLCELIKDTGFDGVAYKSSVGTGDNIALFTENKVSTDAITSYHVSNISIEAVEQLTGPF